MSATQFNPFTDDVEEIRSSWGWFLVLGILSVILGLGCMVFNVSATFATVLVFGWVLLVGAAVALVEAFRAGNWRGFFLYLLSAVFRGVTGYMLIRYPLMGAETLTLMLASFFIVGGIFRAVGSAVARFPRWGWAVVSGALSSVLGAVLLAQMPVSGLWFIGFAIGVDLISAGIAEIAFAMAVHSLPNSVTSGTSPWPQAVITTKE
jgi:uncharacterized membrane protein HdeD (DUF308 family)